MNDLYTFALLMTRSEEKAEIIIQRMLLKLENTPDMLYKDQDLKVHLFKKLYLIYLETEHQPGIEANGYTNEILEEFLLYKRLEENHIIDDHMKLKVLESIDENEFNKILNELPPQSRAYLLLNDMFEFTYEHISYIMNVTINETKDNLNQARKMLQSKIWKKIQNRIQSPVSPC